MGRSNAPPNVPLLAQSEPLSAPALSEPDPDADSTLGLVSTPSLEVPSLVSVNGDYDQETVSSLSPTNSDHLYHEAPDYNEPDELYSHQLVFGDGSHTSGTTHDPKVDARASGIGAAPLEESPIVLQGIPSFPALTRKALRGASASLASPTGPSVVSPIALAASRSPRSTTAFASASQQPTKRAVVVGINYTDPNHDPSRRLRYGVNDARCVASSLRTCGFPSEAVIVLTDQEGQEEPKRATHGGLISWIDWLVGDARAGDLLVFFFSGHGCPGDSSLVMADGKHFCRDLLHGRLVQPIPRGCDLHVMLDCCSASSMIELQYCIGRMFPKPHFTPTVVLPAYDPASFSPPISPLPSLTQPINGLPTHMAFAVSLSGAASVNNVPPDRVPVMFDPRASVPGGSIGLYQGIARGGVSAVAISPLPSSAETQISHPTRSTPFILSGAGQAPTGPSAAPPQIAPTRGSPRGRQAPVQSDQARDYFLERSGRLVKPAGRVMLWASTGAYQSTFEAYNGREVRNGVKIRNGIVPNAICSALNACVGSGLIVRDLWRRIVGHIEQENDWRRERDAAKPKSSRPNPFLREQYAELWVSQPEPLSAAGPVLDRPVLSA